MTFVLLLRGINVGGRNKLPMRDLRADLEALGLRDVRTYIQSGNVVFESGMESRDLLASSIADAVEAGHGFRPHVHLRPADALRRAAEANPFPEDQPKTLHLFFLDAPPPAPDLAALEAVRAETERFHLDGDVFYLHAPDGIGRSKLAQRAERLLGVPATARNWRTVQKLQELAAVAASSS